MERILKAALAVLVSFVLAVPPVAVSAQQLKFDANGEFKILQFTDLYYQSQNPRSRAALRCLDAVIDAERPDLVVLTGDNIYSRPADTAMRNIIDCIDRHGIPYVILFGNHDEEQGLSHAQLYDIIRSGKHNIQPDRNGAESPDYVLEIAGHDSRLPAALLYCMDSHSYSRIKEVGGYAWLAHEQVTWYRSRSRQYTAANGGKPVPALAFFHIPVPEFATAAASENSILIGNRLEAACPPKLNSGMFAAMKEGGDVMGIFCGHDHDNDYTVMHHGIVLGYGRFSGGNTEYNHLPQGARVIVLHEGCRRFDSWIRTRKGEVGMRTVYPDSYRKDNWKTRPVDE